MARKTKRPAKRKAARAPARRPFRPARRSKNATAAKTARRAKVTRTSKRDPLDAFIVAGAQALDLPAKPAWLPAIKFNLRVTLQLAQTVSAFPLPDDAEPAPVFEA